MDILKLSYDSLPQRLKPCFIYFGIYPEDYEINARQLIQLWTAEGFIEPQEAGIPNAVEPEDVAECYLDELVDRSLVQVARRRTDGGVKTCRIHDLLRDLCISESKSEKFLEVCTDLNNMDALRNGNPPRRLSFHCQVDSGVSTNKFSECNTRSLFFFAKEKRWYGVNILKNFKLCRLIHCTAEALYPLPSDLQKLIHLQYLRVEKEMKDIPSCISCLYNLETLDVFYKGTSSSEIWKLKRLRHLYLRGGKELPDLPQADMKRTENLQTLYLRASDPKIVSLMNNDTFLRLRKLVLYYPCPSSYFLEHLKVSSHLHHLSNLESLKMIDSLELPSDANVFPSNLTKMTWKQLRCSSDIFITSMKTLGWLANLQILKLTRQHFDHIFSLDLKDGMFPQLQVFQMRGIKLERWSMEKGAMPCLHSVLIERCPYLFEFPQQLWCLNTLQQVHVLAPSKELANSLQNVELKNGCKLIISHPPKRNS